MVPQLRAVASLQRTGVQFPVPTSGSQLPVTLAPGNSRSSLDIQRAPAHVHILKHRHIIKINLKPGKLYLFYVLR